MQLFYDSYGFFSSGDEYLLLKGNHPCHHFFIPHCSCLVMVVNVNRQNGHLCTFMNHMASFSFGDGYLLVKSNHPCHRFFNPHCSCVVMVDNVNGENGHLCNVMIHMASFCLWLGNFCQKIIIHMQLCLILLLSIFRYGQNMSEQMSVGYYNGVL